MTNTCTKRPVENGGDGNNNKFYVEIIDNLYLRVESSTRWDGT